jgi:hypothetical protein
LMQAATPITSGRNQLSSYHLVTWPEVIYDRHGTSDVAGRPLTYRRLRCMDCDWTGTTRTYAEAVELRTEHELFFTLAAGLTDLATAVV